MEGDHNWDVCWEEIPAAEIDPLTRVIFRKMEEAVSFRDRTVLELGCGTGRLSLLALRAGASRVTLVDSSSKAVALARGLFRGVGEARIIERDFRELEPEGKYDIVFSSGVIEHFRKREILEIVRLHRRHSRQTVLTVVPAGPHYNNLRMRKPDSVRLYGWQRPLTAFRMAALFRGAGIEVTTNRKFHPLYAVPRIEGNRFLERFLRPLEPLIGGLLLTAGRVRGEKEE